MLAHFGIVARQRVGAFEQRFHFKLHAIKHRLARCKTRLAMLGANKAQAGEGWLVTHHLLTEGAQEPASSTVACVIASGRGNAGRRTCSRAVPP